MERDEWFCGLFLENGEALRRYLYRIVRSFHVAEDLAQEAFISVYAATSPIQSPRRYLFRAAHNLAINYLRHERVAATDSVANVETFLTQGNINKSAIEPITPEGKLAAREELATLYAAIRSLAPQCRRVFVLRTIERLSYREIADRLNLSVSMVEKHVARGLRQCHEYIERHELPNNKPRV